MTLIFYYLISASYDYLYQYQYTAAPLLLVLAQHTSVLQLHGLSHHSDPKEPQQASSSHCSSGWACPQRPSTWQRESNRYITMKFVQVLMVGDQTRTSGGGPRCPPLNNWAIEWHMPHFWLSPSPHLSTIPRHKMHTTVFALAQRESNRRTTMKLVQHWLVSQQSQETRRCILGLPWHKESLKFVQELISRWSNKWWAQMSHWTTGPQNWLSPSPYLLTISARKKMYCVCLVTKRVSLREEQPWNLSNFHHSSCWLIIKTVISILWHSSSTASNEWQQAGSSNITHTSFF
jgi:hypothetical protein